MLGYTAAQLRRLTVAQITHSADLPATEGYFKELRAGLTTHRQLVKRYLRQDGRTIWGRLTATLVQNSQGAPLFALGMIEDVTVQRAAAEREDALQSQVLQAETATAAAQQASELQREFVTRVSHQLRTPLTSLLGFSELLLHRDCPPPQQHQYLTVMHEEAKRFTTLVDDVLSLQRLESDQVRYSFADVTVGPLVEQVLALYRGESTSHTLVADVGAGLPPVWADQEQLQQILANLVSNAIKYSPDGGTVRVAAQQEGDEVHVTVTDEGMGIPRESQDQVLERFYRVPGPEREGIRGTGLGLALVKELVKELVAAHRGRVWAESAAPGRGSTFHVAIPVAPSPAVAEVTRAKAAGPEPG
ncbi:MAG: hypothetical protein CL878_08840 [Dehalococcoidia bacterium]|nr:hypothetical protein [Dehalococcoidia bacterium]